MHVNYIFYNIFQPKLEEQTKELVGEVATLRETNITNSMWLHAQRETTETQNYDHWVEFQGVHTFHECMTHCLYDVAHNFFFFRYHID